MLLLHIGRHCCLWCRIERSTLKEVPSKRKKQPVLRDLHTLAVAHSDFASKGGGNITLAKNYFNAIARLFFNIPLNQVSICRMVDHRS